MHLCPYMYNREHQGTKAIPNSLHSWKLKKGEPLNMYFLKKFLFVGFQNHQWHEFITTELHVHDFKMKIACKLHIQYLNYNKIWQPFGKQLTTSIKERGQAECMGYIIYIYWKIIYVMLVFNFKDAESCL